MINKIPFPVLKIKHHYSYQIVKNTSPISFVKQIKTLNEKLLRVFTHSLSAVAYTSEFI